MVRAKTKLWSSAYYDPIPTLSPCNLWCSRIGKQRLRARPSYLSTTFSGIKWEEKGFRSDFSNLPQSTNQSNIFQLLTLTSLFLSLFFLSMWFKCSRGYGGMYMCLLWTQALFTSACISFQKWLPAFCCPFTWMGAYCAHRLAYVHLAFLSWFSPARAHRAAQLSCSPIYGSIVLWVTNLLLLGI